MNNKREKKLYKKIMVLLILITAAAPLYAGQKKNGEEEKIKKVLFAQRDGWNKGNLEEYMEGYWKSDSLKFVGKSGITYGWQKTLENYKKAYPDKKAMGKLDFTVVKIEILGNNSAFMLGRWKLTREKDTPQGYFTLLWKKIGGKWKVVIDHSS